MGPIVVGLGFALGLLGFLLGVREMSEMSTFLFQNGLLFYNIAGFVSFKLMLGLIVHSSL